MKVFPTKKEIKDGEMDLFADAHEGFLKIFDFRK